MPGTAAATLLQALATAIGTVATASAGLQTWAGRATDIIRPAGEMEEFSEKVPILIYALTVRPEIQQAECVVFGYGQDTASQSGQTIANAGLALLEQALTAPALNAAGADAVPIHVTAGEEPDPETAGAPGGAQAQMTVTLLIFG